MQEALLRAIASSAGFADRAEPLIWLSTIALNVLRDHFRRPATRHEAGGGDEALEVISAEDGDLVFALMKGEMGACSAGF